MGINFGGFSVGSSNDDRGKSLLAGPILVIAGVLALWQNEGRFNFYRAAQQAQVVSSHSTIPQNQVVAVSDQLLDDFSAGGKYVEPFKGYYYVDRKAEIYAWENYQDDGKSKWRKLWQTNLEHNSRNADFSQQLKSKHFEPKQYHLGGLAISPKKLHFVDWSKPIPSAELTLTKSGKRLELESSGAFFYLGKKNTSPVLGDERLSYEGISIAPTSTYFGAVTKKIATGKQFGNTDLKFPQALINQLIQNDGYLHYLVNGDRLQALSSMKGYMRWITWAVRLGGTTAIVVGIYVFFSWFTNLLLAIPIIGNLFSAGIFVVSILLGLAISLCVIFAGYFINHPFLSLLPLSLLAVAILYFWNRTKRVKTNTQASLSQHQQRMSQPIGNLDFSPTVARPPSPSTEDTFRSLVKLAVADHMLDEKENRFLVKWGKRKGLEDDQMKNLFAEARNSSDPIQIATHDEFIWMVCLAMEDGSLSSRELTRLKKLGQKLGIGNRELRKIIVDINSGVLSAP